MKRAPFLVLLLLSVWAAGVLGAGPAVKVTMANGDTLSGELLRLSGGELELKTAYLGPIVLPLDQISALSGQFPATLRLTDGSALATEITGLAGGNFQLTSNEHQFVLDRGRVAELEFAGAAPVDLAGRVGAVAGLVEALPKRWSGAANFGYTLNRGTSSSDDVFMMLQAAMARKRDRLSFRSHAFYSVKDSATSKNELFGGLRYERDVTGRLFMFGQAGYEYDEVELIDLRQNYDFGLGYIVVKRPDMRLDFGGGAGVQHEMYADDTSQTDWNALVEEHFLWKFHPRMGLTQNFALVPYLTNESRYRFVLDATFSAALTDSLQFNFGVVDRYDSRPRPGVDKNDLTFITGLGWVF